MIKGLQFAAKKMTRQERKSMMLGIANEWRESGLSQVEFARTHNIKLITLRYWITKQKQSNKDHPAFIQLHGISSQGIHIRYPHGVELVLPVQTPAGFLKSLIHI